MKKQLYTPKKSRKNEFLFVFLQNNKLNINRRDKVPLYLVFMIFEINYQRK